LWIRDVKDALICNGKSLLAKGVKEVKGVFAEAVL
jgi:glutamate 5-kinase